jgi:DNA-binding Lrp family transcriptional regulator
MAAKPDILSLDPVEQHLLALLREDARRPVTSLAHALGISRASVYGRIDRLERGGIIAGYTVKLGEAYDRRLIRAHVMIKVLQKLSRITEKQLAGLPALTALHAISGEYDLIAVIESETVAMLNELIDRIGDLEGVEKTTSSILLASKILR